MDRTAWVASFGDVLPLGYALVQALGTRWLRFHALPDAKRYGDTVAERAEVVARGNRLASRILGEGQACTMLMPRWCPLDGSHGRKSAVQGDAIRRFGMRRLWQLDVANGQEHFEDAHLDVMGAGITWRSGAFDDLLQQIADDRLDALFVSQDMTRVFAPYDGGFDLICATGAERDMFKAHHKDWLSPRADML